MSIQGGPLVSGGYLDGSVRVYAVAADLPGSPTETPDIASRLRTASRLVDLLLVGRVYDTDAAGLPTAPGVAQALTDATVAIATFPEFVSALGAPETQWDNVKIGSVSLSARKSGAAGIVAGLPVPAAAFAALLGVGPLRVVQAGGYSRPLDRIAT